MNVILPLALAFLIGVGFNAAYAHTTVSVGPYDIEVGWGIEPPVVGIRNTIVLEISERGEVEGIKRGVNNAFAGLSATIQSGGASKTLDINADIMAGHYHSPIIPTKTGSILVNVHGSINETPVDVDIPIEDVETTAILDFPPRSSAGDADIAALKAAVSSLQSDAAGQVASSQGVENIGPAYDYAVFGMSLGAAGVIMAVIALVKRK